MGAVGGRNARVAQRMREGNIVILRTVESASGLASSRGRIVYTTDAIP